MVNIKKQCAEFSPEITEYLEKAGNNKTISYNNNNITSSNNMFSAQGPKEEPLGYNDSNNLEINYHC